MPRSASTPGIADIAADCDVSIATVSRVLTGKANVTDDVRTRVLSAVKRLNYRPLRRPKRSYTGGPGLQEGQKAAIAYVSQEAEQRGARVKWHHAFHAASRRLQEAGRSLNLHFLPPTTAMAEPTNGDSPAALHDQYAGLIAVDRGDERWVRMVTQSGLPAVRLGYFPLDIPIPQVVADTFHGSLKLMEHLISRGHKRIAIWRVRAPIGSGRALNEREKYAAYRFALDEAGIEFKKEWEINMDFNWQDVVPCAKNLLAVKPAPTALFIDNDWTTWIISRWPGGELPLPAGWLSNFEIGHFMDMGRAPSEFPYACSELPMDRMGEMAADMLLQQFAGRNYQSDYMVKVPPHFHSAEQVMEHAKATAV